MKTKNSIQNYKNTNDMYHIHEGQLVEWRGAIVEIKGCSDANDRVILCLKGGDLVPARAGELKATEAKKKALPVWCKRGTVIAHQDGQKYVIESVGRTQVYFCSGGAHQLAAVMLYYAPLENQPLAPSWLVPGAKVKCRGYGNSEVLDVQGMAVRCRCDIGNGESFELTCTPDHCELKEKPVYSEAAKSPVPEGETAVCEKKAYSCKGESIPYWEVRLGRKKVCEINYPSEILGSTSFKVSFPHIGMAITDVQTLQEAQEKAQKYLFEFFHITKITDRLGYPFDLCVLFEDPLLQDVA